MHVSAPCSSNPPIVDAAVTALTFALDRSLLVAGYADGTLRLWDVADSIYPVEIRHAQEGHTSSIVALGYDDDRSSIISVDLSGRLLSWQIDAVDSTQAMWVERVPSGEPITAAVHHDDRLVTAAGAGTITVREIGGDGVITWEHGARVEVLAISPDGETLISGGRDNIARGWSLTDPNRQPTEFIFHTNWITGATFIPEQQALATVSRDSTLVLWDIESGFAPAVRRSLSNQRFGSTLRFCSTK